MNINKLPDNIHISPTVTELKQHMETFNIFLGEDIPQLKNELSLKDEITLQSIDERIQKLNEHAHNSVILSHHLECMRDVYIRLLQETVGEVDENKDDDKTLTFDILMKNGFCRPEPVTSPSEWMLLDKTDQCALIRLFKKDGSFEMKTSDMSIILKTVKDLRRLYRAYGLSDTINA